MTLHHTPPFLRAERHTAAIMCEVCIALVPPMVSAVYFFRWQAVVLLGTAALIGTLTDAVSGYVLRGSVTFDGAAPVSSLILALSCPAGTPLWLLSLLCVMAVTVFRDAFGGIGCNIFNPAMAARAVLLTVFPAYVSGYALPDALSSATPLSDGNIPLPLLFSGRVSGSMGETSVPMILLGLGYLLIRRVVRWRIPCFSLLAFALTTALCGGDVVRQLLSGSILFGAVYIFTDYTGRPTTAIGETVFAVGAGTLTALFRTYGTYPEGVCFAVLTMNVLTPALEWYTRPRVYGNGYHKRKEKPV